MKLVYQGPHRAVVVDDYNPALEIENGVPVEIPDEIARNLLEQDIWAAAKSAKASAAKSADHEKDAD